MGSLKKWTELDAENKRLRKSLRNLTNMSIDDWTDANNSSSSPQAAKLREAMSLVAS